MARRAGALLCCIAALVAACGDEPDRASTASEAPRLTVPRYAARLESAREAYLKELAKPRGTDPTQPGVGRKYELQTSRATATLARRLDRLRPPTVLDAAHRRYAGAVHGSADASRALATAGLALVPQRSDALGKANAEAGRARVALDRRVRELR